MGDVKFSEKYYSARLVEKLRSLDGIHIKDKALVQQIKNDLTKELITEGLMLDWARKNKVQVSKAEIQELLQKLVSTDEGGVREDVLSSSNVNRALLEDSLGIQLLKKELSKELEKRVRISDQEILSYYQSHVSQFKKGRIHLKQIFLAQEGEAESVLKFLRSGKFTFEALAEKYSMGAEASKGGDMGWIESGQVAHIDSMFNRGPGVVDKVVTSPQGFHIYKIIEVQRPALQPLSQVREEVIRSIKEQKIEGSYLTWTEEQLRRASVKTNDEIIQSLSPTYQETP